MRSQYVIFEVIMSRSGRIILKGHACLKILIEVPTPRIKRRSSQWGCNFKTSNEFDTFKDIFTIYLLLYGAYKAIGFGRKVLESQPCSGKHSEGYKYIYIFAQNGKCIITPDRSGDNTGLMAKVAPYRLKTLTLPSAA